jgi:hypothetical protein
MTQILFLASLFSENMFSYMSLASTILAKTLGKVESNADQIWKNDIWQDL